MKTIKYITFILVITVTSLSAQIYKLSESEKDVILLKKPVEVVLQGIPFLSFTAKGTELSFTAKGTEKDSCKLKEKEKVLIIGIYGSRFLIKAKECRGFLWDFFVINNTELDFQVSEAKKRAIKKNIEEKKWEREEERIRSVQAFEDNRSKCQYRVNEVDAFNGKSRKYTAIYKLSGIGDLVVQLCNFGGLRYVMFSTTHDLGCVSSYNHDISFAKVKLENGDMITFYHFEDIDCGAFDLYGKITPGDIARLQKSPIEQIRLQGTEYYHDFQDIVYKEVFIDKLNCIK